MTCPTLDPIPSIRCDYVPMWSGSEHRCAAEALVRVVTSHGAGDDPVFKERCLRHAAGDLGPRVIAYLDQGNWVGSD